MGIAVRHVMGVVLGVALAATLASCGGRTAAQQDPASWSDRLLPPENFRSWSYRLFARKGCPGRCASYFRYRAMGSAEWKHAPATNFVPGSSPRGDGTSVSTDVRGLKNGQEYEYQICAKETADEPACVGPDGTNSSTQRFMTPWRSTFATRDFSEWGDDHSRPDASIYRVESVARAGIPRRPGSSDTNVARFEVTAGDYAVGKVHSKLYKGFVLRGSPMQDWSGGTLLSRRGEEGGTYRAWFYLPADYRMGAPGQSDANVNLFQFKEFWPVGSNDTSSSVQAVAGLSKQARAARWGHPVPGVARDDDTTPLLTVNWSYAERRPAHTAAMRAPLGRWFEIRAEVHPGDRIDWFVDGHPFTTVTQADIAATAPPDANPKTRWSRGVGLSIPRGSGPAAGAGPSENFVFGVGHYGVPGRVWVDEAQFVPFP